MAEKKTGKDIIGKAAGHDLTVVSMARLATSCPWVIKGLAQNSTFLSPAARDLPARKPVKAGRRLH